MRHTQHYFNGKVRLDFSSLPMTVVPGTTCSGAMVVTLPADAMFGAESRVER